MPDHTIGPVDKDLVFPSCLKCPYLKGGPAKFCLDCFRNSTEKYTGESCEICGQRIEDTGCKNKLCHSQDRYVQKIHHIQYHEGELQETIHRYKYENKYGWASIFGRFLFAWLEENLTEDRPDLIVANPTHESRKPRHTEHVIEAAQKEDSLDNWAFDVADTRALIKTQETKQSAKKSYKDKEVAAEALLEVLSISCTKRTEDKYILVYDDICTTGLRLNAVAKYLQENGRARRVEGIVLARAPWKGAKEQNSLSSKPTSLGI